MISFAIAVAGRRLAAEEERCAAATRRRRRRGGSAGRAQTTCSTFRCCRLYSWMRLHLDVEERVGIDGDARRVARATPARRSLLACFTARQRSRNAGVLGERLEPAQPVEVA